MLHNKLDPGGAETAGPAESSVQVLHLEDLWRGNSLNNQLGNTITLTDYIKYRGMRWAFKMHDYWRSRNRRN